MAGRRKRTTYSPPRDPVALVAYNRALIDGATTEADFQAAVISQAALFGWAHYHTHDSRRSPGGFPDLILIHEGRGRMIVAELKKQGEQPRPDQREWLARFSAVALTAPHAIRVFVWRPADADEIERELRR